MARVKYPRLAEDFQTYAQALRDHVLRGFIPAAPPFSRDDVIITQGSCFAENIYRALVKAGIKCGHNKILEACNTPKANRLFFEYALRGKPYASQNHAKAVPAALINGLRTALPHIRAMIYTVGLIYEPYLDGEFVFNWQEADAPRIEWRESSVTENIAHLDAIVTMLREANPRLAIIFTLSPIPIATIHQDLSPLVADCLSKSTLRTAIGEVLTRRGQDVAYWPAFEAIRWLSGHMGQVFGTDEDPDHRHPGPSYIRAIVDAFISAYFQPGLP